MFNNNYIRFITILKNDLSLKHNILKGINGGAIQKDLNTIFKKINTSEKEIKENIEKDLRMIEIREHCINNKIMDLHKEKQLLKEDYVLLNYLKYYL